jgi:hypothetical protein
LIELARQALRFVYPRERGPQLIYIVFPTGALELSFGAGVMLERSPGDGSPRRN